MDLVDWQTGKTNSESSKYMLENEVNCDVSFKVGENEDTIKAHKFILSMRSAVFDRMFNGGFCEADKDPVIPDVTAAAFKMMLRYCYYDCLDIEDDIALSVLYASTKYMLPLLEEAARKKLIDILSSSNIWEIYKYAIDVGDTILLEGCWTFFQGDITPVKEALQTEAFLNIPHKLLLDLLHINDQVDIITDLKGDQGEVPDSNTQSSSSGRPKAKGCVKVPYKNSIGISISEIELFQACDSWGQAECIHQGIDVTGTNKRTVLGDCLFLIRFPTMLQKDLATIVHQTGILTNAEIVNLGFYMHQDPDSECQVDFPSRERQFVVTPPEFSEELLDVSTLYIESDVRAVLSQVWIRGAGRYKVSVNDLTSETSFSMKCDTKFRCHYTKEINTSHRYLHIIDIKLHLLEPGNKYSISAERINFDSREQALVTKRFVIDDLSPFKELKMTASSMQNNIHGLTLCLI